MRAMMRCTIAALMCAGAITMASAQTLAEQYPQRAVKFVLPFGPGSGSDIAARLIAEKLQTKWGKPVVVEPDRAATV